jgi:hypothetical protein
VGRGGAPLDFTASGLPILHIPKLIIDISVQRIIGYLEAIAVEPGELILRQLADDGGHILSLTIAGYARIRCEKLLLPSNLFMAILLSVFNEYTLGWIVIMKTLSGNPGFSI